MADDQAESLRHVYEHQGVPPWMIEPIQEAVLQGPNETSMHHVQASAAEFTDVNVPCSSSAAPEGEDGSHSRGLYMYNIRCHGECFKLPQEAGIV